MKKQLDLIIYESTPPLNKVCQRVLTTTIPAHES